MEKRLTLRSHQVDIMNLDFWRGYSFCILLLIWHGKKVCHTIEGWLLLFYASPSVALTAIILIPLYMVPSFLNKSELERLVAKEREAGDLWFQEFDVILNGKVSITLNKVENYMQNRYNEALKSYLDARNRQHFLLADNLGMKLRNF